VVDNQLYQSLLEWTGDNARLVQVFIVVFLLVQLFNLVLRLVLKRLQRKLRGTDNPWDDAVIGASQQPLNLLVWIAGIAFAAAAGVEGTGQA
jgi:MscS family membrane protein